jgi:translation initiation factor 1 (eIF-1/SUI1)
MGIENMNYCQRNLVQNMNVLNFTLVFLAVANISLGASETLGLSDLRISEPRSRNLPTDDAGILRSAFGEPRFDGLTSHKTDALVEYCQQCTFPTEYCADVGCPNAKRPRSNSLERDNTTSPANGTAEEPLPPRSRGGKAPKPAKPAQVTIKLTLRGSKKYVTTVAGLEAFLPPPAPGAAGGLKDAARVMANKLAAGASVVKGGPGEGGDHIVIQGDVVQAVSALCADRLGVPSAAIRVAKTEAKNWKMK